MYLDYAASTPVLPEVIEKLIKALDYYGNPSSIHNAGIRAKNLINEATKIISEKINCKPEEIHYTSGATMSNSLAIQGFLKNTNGLFITDNIEHDDIMLLAEDNKKITYLVSNDVNGIVSISHLENILKMIRKKVDTPVLVSIQMANSETGVIQDIKSISKIVHTYKNVYLHTDATQYIPYFYVDVNEFGIDMLSMSGQKIGGLKGTGILYVKEGTPISPIIYGEQGLIGGTENVYGIACLGEAFKNINYDIEELRLKRDYMASLLCGKLVTKANRLPNNIMMHFNGVTSESMIAILNEHEIYVSGGSACSSLSDKPSHVLTNMGFSEDEAKSCIRITIPKEITYEDINMISSIINENYKLLS